MCTRVLNYDPMKTLAKQRIHADVPRKAKGAKAKKSMETMQLLSIFYGAKIELRDGFGVIAL